LFIFPCECDSLSYKEGEWLDDFGILLDKATVEVSEPEEYTDILEVARSFPIFNSGNLFWIHFDSFSTDDEAQVLDFLAVKLALFWFEV
jgi:DNA polymerase III delta subunit